MDPSQSDFGLYGDDLMSEGTHVGQKKQPWIGYRTEYRNYLTDELIHQKDTDGPEGEGGNVDNVEHPVFELVTTYKTRLVDSNRKQAEGIASVPPSSASLSTPAHHLNIYSTAIINALQSVVRYYPSQDLSGDLVRVNWPYPVLVHHYSELKAFRERCSVKDQDAMCVRERHAVEHLDILFDFLEGAIMEDVYAEQERNKRGFHTFEYLWLKMRPGTTILFKLSVDKDWHSCVIHSVSGGVFENPSSEWAIKYWSMCFDGQFLGRSLSSFIPRKFDGEVKIDYSFVFTDDESLSEEKLSTLNEAVTNQYNYGKKYWSLLRKQCKYHKGISRDFPFNQASTLKDACFSTAHTLNRSKVLL